MWIYLLNHNSPQFHYMRVMASQIIAKLTVCSRTYACWKQRKYQLWQQSHVSSLMWIPAPIGTVSYELSIYVLLYLPLTDISVWNSSKKSCRSSWLESKIINIKLKKNQQKVPGPPPKLSASDWQTCGNFQHCRLTSYYNQLKWHD